MCFGQFSNRNRVLTPNMASIYSHFGDLLELEGHHEAASNQACDASMEGTASLKVCVVG